VPHWGHSAVKVPPRAARALALTLSERVATAEPELEPTRRLAPVEQGPAAAEAAAAE
jgi:hypothetical protein